MTLKPILNYGCTSTVETCYFLTMMDAHLGPLAVGEGSLAKFTVAVSSGPSDIFSTVPWLHASPVHGSNKQY